MAKKRYHILDNFQGVNTGVSERQGPTYAQLAKNFDSNIEKGKLVSRNGSSQTVDTAAANVDKFVAYRDTEWDKDVLLIYDKNATVASRQITLYHKTAGASGNYAKQTSYSYGNIQFGDDINFLIHKNAVRIGTGTGASNKALYAGYIDRSVSGRHGAMFNDAVSFSDFFLTKQQWVQQPDMFTWCRKVRWDSTRERYYCLTQRGLEIRTSDWRIDRVLNDVVAYEAPAGKQLIGGVEIIGSNLYVLGIETERDGSDDIVYKLLYYDLSNGFAVGATTVSKTDATGDKMYGIASDGSQIFMVWTDGTDGFMDIYSSTLSTVQAKAYTGSGYTELMDITTVGSNAYIIDNGNKQVIQVLKASPYTAATWATGKTDILNNIENDGTELILSGFNSPSSYAYNVTINGTFSSSTISNTETYTSQEIYELSVTNSIVPYLFRYDTNQLLHFNDTSGWTLTTILPGKISLAVSTGYTSPPASSADAADTHFYGVSVVDIDGQEHHLMTGMATPQHEEPEGNYQSLRIVVSAQSELYDSDHSSPSSSPTVQNSIWSDLRRIKTLRVYRAWADDWGAGEPTSNYRFVEDIDINDVRWSEDFANLEYSIEIPISVATTELSTLTYEESSDLPEVFKPYYTNWLHATEQGGNFYYGNMRTDELTTSQVLQTPLYSPDIAYQLDTNVDLFGVDDGDDIQGLAPSWSRLIIFKSQRCAVNSGLNRQAIYDIGTTAPDSILVHNNTVYFVYGSSIYSLTPSGYRKISQPIDTLLSAEVMTGVSSVVFKEKDKLWFQVSGSDTYLYNYNEGTWDIYDLNTGSINQIYVAEGVDGQILTLNDNDDTVYHQNSTLVEDNGADYSVYFFSNQIPLGGGVIDSDFHHLFMTYSSTESITVRLYTLNRNGENNSDHAFPSNVTGRTRSLFLSGEWGQVVYYRISQTISAALRIDNISIEYSNTEALVNA